MIVWGGFNDFGPFFLNTGGRYCAQPSPTATPTATPAESCLVKEVSLCNSVVSTPPTDFIVQMSCPVDSVQSSGFRVNDTGADSFTVSKSTITFHFNTSPVIPGLNTIHILNDAITCCIRPVSEFTCTFTYVPTTPTPTATASPTPTATSTPTPSPRPTPIQDLVLHRIRARSFVNEKECTAQSGFFPLRVSFTLLLWSVASWILGTTVLGFFRAEAPRRVSETTLTFAERVTYQRAIENVYWRHRIWPKERPDPKPSLDAVISQAQLEKKVADYLRKSQTPEDYWQRPITAKQLQAEMDRMARHTRQPEVLRELFEALGNDPFVIAECLARPLLAERLITTRNDCTPNV